MAGEAFQAVSLVPPRFRREKSTREELEARVRSPFNEALALQQRQRVLDAHISAPGIWLSSALGVDQSVSAFAHVGASTNGSPCASGAVLGREGRGLLSGNASDTGGDVRGAIWRGGAGVFGRCCISTAPQQSSGDPSSMLDHCNSYIGLRYGTRNFGAGVGVTSTQLHDLQRLQSPPGIAWAVGKSGPLIGGAEYDPTHGPRCGIGIRRSDRARGATVDASATISPTTGEMATGYVFSQAIRRRVRNVLEDERVRSITSYIDIAFELRGGPNRPAEWTLGLSGQLNKNVLGKVSLGPSYGLRSAVALKLWTDPSVELSLTSQVPLAKAASATPDLGISIHIENIGTAVYSHASGSRAQREKNKLLPASEGEIVDLESRITFDQGESVNEANGPDDDDDIL